VLGCCSLVREAPGRHVVPNGRTQVYSARGRIGNDDRRSMRPGSRASVAPEKAFLHSFGHWVLDGNFPMVRGLGSAFISKDR